MCVNCLQWGLDPLEPEFETVVGLSLCVCMCMCVRVWVSVGVCVYGLCMCTRAQKTKFWSGPLQELQILLTAEPSL